MKVTFDNFDELAEWVYKKKLAYEELRDENRQLEMDRLKDSDRIAELEAEVYELKRIKASYGKSVPNVLLAKNHKRSWHADDENIQEVVANMVDEGSEINEEK